MTTGTEETDLDLARAELGWCHAEIVSLRGRLAVAEARAERWRLVAVDNADPQPTPATASREAANRAAWAGRP